MQLGEKDISLINALVTHFYNVVPHEYKTYCSLTARISQAVLTHVGIDAKLLPCQVWLVTDEQNFVVGFVGATNPRKWDGHVVCQAQNVIIDAALKHFEKEFGFNVPDIIAAHCFNVPTQVISHYHLKTNADCWWHYPPATPDIDLNAPDEPQDIVTKYASQLIAHLANLAIARSSA